MDNSKKALTEPRHLAWDEVSDDEIEPVLDLFGDENSHKKHNNNTSAALSAEENNLAQQLKDIYDDATDTEKKPKQSAEVLRKLALLYSRRTSNVINLIQSAALYNAAIARSPDNVQEIENDLKRLCHQVLELTEAKDLNADLVEASKKVKREIQMMRDKVEKTLNSAEKIETSLEIFDEQIMLESKKIETVKAYQKEIAADFKNIMANVAKYCENVMGEAPCEFAVVGMGSLARKEITPYSDFEHIIVLEEMSWKKSTDPKILNYFRSFSLLFHIVLINLQETILPDVDIPSLNRHPSYKNWFFDRITTRGICFDGMQPHACKFPIGRQKHTEKKSWTTELIKPISAMLNYLTTEEDLKNGYHLKDILTKICYVYGRKEIFDQFQKRVFEKLEMQNKDEKLEEVKKLIIDDLDLFTVRSNILRLRSSKTLNIKKLVYRSTTLFIAALGRIYNIRSSSCFDIVEELASQNVVEENTKHMLLYAVALACEKRLKWYMKCRNQTDIIEVESNEETVLQILIDLVGKSNLLLYFQIAYALQCDVSKRLNLKKKHFYTDPYILMFNLELVFGNVDALSKDFLDAVDMDANTSYRLKTFDETIQILKDAKKHNQSNTTQKTTKDTQNVFTDLLNETYNTGLQLLSMNKHDEAIEFFDTYMFLHKREVTDEIAYLDIACPTQNASAVFQQIRKINEDEMEENARSSNEITQDAKEVQQQTDETPNTSLSSSVKINDELNAEKNQFIRKISLQQSTGSAELPDALNNIGACLIDMNKPQEALDYYKRSLAIKKCTSSDLSTDEAFATILNNIGRCLNEMDQQSEALKYFQQAIKIKEKVSSNLDSDENYSAMINNVGMCFKKMKNYTEAIRCLKQSMKIEENISKDFHTSKSYAMALNNIGFCLIDMSKFSEALEYFQRSRKIKEQVSTHLDTDISFATTLSNIGLCYMTMESYSNAFEYLERSLEIEERVSLDLDSDENFAAKLHNVGTCLLGMNDNRKALGYLQRSKKIVEQTAVDLKTDINYAVILRNIGFCMSSLGRREEAMDYLRRSENIEKASALKFRH